MLDLLWFILWCVPILGGLWFVLLSLKEHSRTAVVSVPSKDPHATPPAGAR